MPRVPFRARLRPFAGGAATVGSAAASLFRQATGADSGHRRPSDRIAAENRSPGSNQWEAGADDTRIADDLGAQIKAYASATSINIGEAIDFHVSVNPDTDTDADAAFTIAIYRVGHYAGVGARKILESPTLTGVRQPPPAFDPATGAITCDWPVAWTLDTATTWASGFYIAVFTTTTGWRNYTPFVVRDDALRADICIILPFATSQAYNQWPQDGRLGKSLYFGYDAEGEVTHTTRAHKVSFDRPYDGEGLPRQIRDDIEVIRWVEEQQYEVTYASSIDLHAGRIDPTRFSALVFSGHDEYWTQQMRTVAVRAVAAGTSLAFMAANNMYWHVRLEAAADGRDHRNVVCYKTDPDPAPDANGTTITWRAAPPGPGNPEQGFLGVQYRAMVAKYVPLVVHNADHWFWAETGARDGDEIDNLIGGEADDIDSRYPLPADVTQTLLSQSPYDSPYQGPNGTREMQTTSLLEASTGAVIFVAGTFNWAYGLNLEGFRDERIRLATANLFNRMLEPRPTDDSPRAHGKRAVKPSGNPIEVENAQPGSRRWQVSVDDTRPATDIGAQIKGYASATSVNIGEPIDFHVSVKADQDFTIGIYRIGHYDGVGARKLTESPILAGRHQRGPHVDDTTGAITCDWPTAWTLDTPTTWTSGVYIAVFTTTNGWRSYTPFVVRDDARQAELCVILPFTTYQAYNLWPVDKVIGKSLYYGYENGKAVYPKRAFHVSFDRPYPKNGLPDQFNGDLDFIRWAESAGYDLSYATSIDLHAGRVDPERHAGLIFPGQDQYWSQRMRDVATAAVEGGANLAFMAANNIHWRVRIEPGPDGRDDRTVVCYKTDPDPAPDSGGTTVKWRTRAPGPGAPEQSLLGVQYRAGVPEPVPLVIQSADHWFWSGTGVADGDAIDNIVGGEADDVDPRYRCPEKANQTLLSASPYTLRDGTGQTQNTSIYETPDGNLVFVAGTRNWASGLYHDAYQDHRIQAATANLLSRMRIRATRDGIVS